MYQPNVIGLKIPTRRREAGQLAIYKHDRGVELGSTEKQLQLSGQSGTWTRDLRISSPAP